MDDARALLRHILATLAYRAGKTLRAAPEGFATFASPGTTRTPLQILAHMGDLIEWALSMASGQTGWQESAPLEWPHEVTRFFNVLERFDAYLASPAPLGGTPERLFQGPLADALTHVGQLAMLRRQFGAPIRPENYYKAEIASGRVGFDQAPPRREFG